MQNDKQNDRRLVFEFLYSRPIPISYDILTVLSGFRSCIFVTFAHINKENAKKQLFPIPNIN